MPGIFLFLNESIWKPGKEFLIRKAGKEESCSGGLAEMVENVIKNSMR
jgi:hypothetical protein